MKLKGRERLSLILRASLPAMLRMARRTGREVLRKPVVYLVLALLIFGAFFSTFAFVPPAKKAYITY